MNQHIFGMLALARLGVDHVMGGRLKVTALLAGEFGFGGNEVARASCFEHCGPIFRHQCWQGLQYSAYIEHASPWLQMQPTRT